MTLKLPTPRNAAVLAALLYAAAGAGLMIDGGCGDLLSWDPESQQWHPATPETIARIAETAQPAVDLALAATGQTAWIPIADLVLRLVALLFAYKYVRQPPLTPAPALTTLEP